MKSPMNLNRARCYKVGYIALSLMILRTKKFKLVTLSYLQGESQVYVFHLLVEVGFLPFYEHGLLKLYLVLCNIDFFLIVVCF